MKRRNNKFKREVILKLENFLNEYIESGSYSTSLTRSIFFIENFVKIKSTYNSRSVSIINIDINSKEDLIVVIDKMSNYYNSEPKTELMSKNYFYIEDVNTLMLVLISAFKAILYDIYFYV